VCCVQEQNVSARHARASRAIQALTSQGQCPHHRPSDCRDHQS
jgi:hypothetical protein